MKRTRLDQLADGIFAIVMTIMVLDFEVPIFDGLATNASLLSSIGDLFPVLLAYILTFLVLFTYWIAHHYMLSLIAKNLTRTLTHLNIPFLILVALIPFTTKLLSAYYYTQTAIFVYGIHVVLIGISLIVISKYIIKSPEIKVSKNFTSEDLHIANLRIMFPPAASAIAIVVSLFSPKTAILLFILSVLVNLIPGSLRYIVNNFTGFRSNNK